MRIRDITSLICIVSLFGQGQGLFVPEQLPTLLSFIYTNIPPIRKGTDSRVGFGFRLGPNADVQVMLEIGPQKNTAPIGVKSLDNAKREVYLPFRMKNNKKPWLQAWKDQQMMQDGEGDDIGVVPAERPLDRDIIAHLKQLYKEVPQQTNVVQDETGQDSKQQKTEDITST